MTIMDESAYPVYPSAVAVTILAAIALVLDIPPLIWHINRRNLAAASLVFWIMLANVMNFTNSLIWRTDDISAWWSGAGLCDVEVKLQIAGSFGFVGSQVAIMRNLARVLNTKSTVLSPSKSERRRERALGLMLCFGGPVYAMAIHYVVQPSRYYVFTISGCTVSYDNSWPKLVLILIWPPIMGIAVVYYSVLVIIRMRRYRREFSAVLSSSGSNMTKSRFLRLFLLSLLLIIVVLPTQSYVLYQNSVVPLLPYNWRLVHGSDWNHVYLVPAGGVVIFDRWAEIAVGFVVFPFFGLGQEAQKMYRKGLLKMGLGCWFPSLQDEAAGGTQQGSITNSHTASLSSRARLLFHKKQSRGSLFSLHSRGNSIPPSSATLSPAETQGAFGHLSTITEAVQPAHRPNMSSNLWYHNPRPSTSGGPQEPWLDELIYTRMPAEMPASYFQKPVRRNRDADLPGFGVSECDEEKVFDRSDSSGKKKGFA